MVRVMIYNLDSKQTRFGGSDLLAEWTPDGPSWIWVDLNDEDRQREAELLTRHFGIDGLAISDAQRDRHPPKLEVFDSYFFLLLKGLNAETTNIEFGTIQLALFVGERFLITRRAQPSPSTDKAWGEAENGALALARGPAHTAYRVARLVTDRYAPIVLGLEQRLDALEDEMFEHPRDELLEELIHYIGNLKKLRRVFSYQQALMAELARGQIRFFGKPERHEFNDVYEHMERLASLSSLYQELAADLMNGYISLNSHRLNQIMKTLTIVTVIFLPLALLVGVYGMNFENMPELHSRYGYFILLAVMTSITVVLLTIFRRVKWL